MVYIFIHRFIRHYYLRTEFLNEFLLLAEKQQMKNQIMQKEKAFKIYTITKIKFFNYE